VTAIPHIGYIAAAFAITAVAVAAMIGSIWLDYRDLTAKLARLERRPSERP
jgi:heme exporter protein CcmD